METIELVPSNDVDGTHVLPTDPTPLLYTSFPHNNLLSLASWPNCKLCFVTKFHQSANNFYQATTRQNLLKSNRKFLNTKIEGTEGKSGNGNSKKKQQMKRNSCEQLIMLPALVVLGRVSEGLELLLVMFYNCAVSVRVSLYISLCVSLLISVVNVCFSIYLALFVVLALCRFHFLEIFLRIRPSKCENTLIPLRFVCL